MEKRTLTTAIAESALFVFFMIATSFATGAWAGMVVLTYRAFIATFG